MSESVSESESVSVSGLKSLNSFAAVSSCDRLYAAHATCSNTQARRRTRPSCIRWSITFSLTWDTTFQMATFNHNDCYYFGAAFHSKDFLRLSSSPPLEQSARC